MNKKYTFNSSSLSFVLIQKKQSRSFGTRLTWASLNFMLAALLVLNSGGTPHSNRTACNVHSLQILRYLLVGRFSSKLKNFIPEGLNEIKIPLVQNSCRKLRRTGAVATRSWQGGFCLIRQKIPKRGRHFFWFVFFRRVKKMNRTWFKVTSIPMVNYGSGRPTPSQLLGIP